MYPNPLSPVNAVTFLSSEKQGWGWVNKKQALYYNYDIFQCLPIILR